MDEVKVGELRGILSSRHITGLRNATQGMDTGVHLIHSGGRSGSIVLLRRKLDLEFFSMRNLPFNKRPIDFSPGCAATGYRDWILAMDIEQRMNSLLAQIDELKDRLENTAIRVDTLMDRFNKLRNRHVELRDRADEGFIDVTTRLTKLERQMALLESTEDSPLKPWPNQPSDGDPPLELIETPVAEGIMEFSDPIGGTARSASIEADPFQVENLITAFGGVVPSMSAGSARLGGLFSVPVREGSGITDLEELRRKHFEEGLVVGSNRALAEAEERLRKWMAGNFGSATIAGAVRAVRGSE